MSKTRKTLEWSLISGSIYFLCISIAHFFEIKMLGLFVYYDVNSYEYQNKIISMLAFGWSSFFLMGKIIIDIKKIKYLIFQIASGFFAIVTMVTINLSKELESLVDGTSLFKYWVSTFFLFLYWLLLLFLYIKVMRKTKNE